MEASQLKVFTPEDAARIMQICRDHKPRREPARALRLKAVEVVTYEQDYNEARRVATIKLEDGRYIDLTVDDSGRPNFTMTLDGSMEKGTLYCVIPSDPSSQLILRGSVEMGELIHL